MAIDRLSVELTRRCPKACWFCYNASSPAGATRWTTADLVALATDAAEHGVEVLSLGGGEPLLFDGWRDLLAATRGRLARSMTTSGLTLDHAAIDDLAALAIDKVHVSIHFPEDPAEVDRVLGQLRALEDAGVPAGCNLLVRSDALDAAAQAAARLRDQLSPARIVYLPLRGVPGQTPTPHELARVAGGARFQSMTCLLGCARSPRFASIDWARRVAWCSYTTSRRPLAAPTFAAVEAALDGLPLTFCGPAAEEAA